MGSGMGSGTHGGMELRQIARRFPLIARPRPPCRPLPERIQTISAMASAAERDNDLAQAAAAHNQAALLASDCAMPDLARTLCWRQSSIYLHAQPLNARQARHALEPLVNLARLYIRADNGHAAAEVLTRLFHAVTTRTDTVIDGRRLSLQRLSATQQDHQELHRWLWTVVVADGTRALASTGEWNKALAHAKQHKGIGERLLDGRQIAIVSHLLAGDTVAAMRLLQQSAPGEPWENVVQACLTVLCLPAAARHRDQAITSMVEAFMELPEHPGLAVFRTRLGMTIIDTTDKHNNSNAQVTNRLLREAMATQDAYVAREILAHHTLRHRLASAARHALSDIIRSGGLQQGAIGDAEHNDLLAAVEMAEEVIAGQVEPVRRLPIDPAEPMASWLAII